MVQLAECGQGGRFLVKLFVISLADSTERRRSIKKRLSELGLEFQFFDAIDGRQGLPPDLETYVDRNRAQQKLGRPLSDPEIACALSHAFLYQHILEQDLEEAIILEDDMVPSESFRALIISGKLSQAQQDLILFYYNYAQAFRFSFRSFFGEYKKFWFAALPSSTAAYYVSRRGAGVLHKAALPISFVADWPLLIPFRMRTAGLYPPPVLHSSSESLLELQRTQETPHSTQRESLLQIAQAGGLRAILDHIYSNFVLAKLAIKVGGSDEENSAGLFW